jgi:putative ABC transport system substrate-binding protein
VFEPRYAHGDLARLPVLAKELARMPVDVIVTGGSSATRPALDATSSIPIVMAQDNDPVGARVVASLARPGGNVTGLSTLVPELSAKQLALIGELVPGVARVALFGDSGEAGNAQSVAEAESAAARLNVEVQYLDLRKIGDPAQLFAAATRGRAGAVLVLASGYLFARQDEVVALALKARLPALYAHPEFVARGGLATYGVNVLGLFRQAAGYVVKILNGTKPADLPVEQPTKFELAINLKTAKALGITIPQSMLLRADEVIR